MGHRARRLRTPLLLGTAFLVGVAIGPATDSRVAVVSD
jgi:hypothetical protein